jgi:peroxiredoxin
MAIEIGTDAPDFSLKDPQGEFVTLSSYEGDTAVAVVFFPFSFSGICEGELCAIRDDYSTFTDAGVQVLAVSCDSRQVQGKWTEQMGYGFPVLSDHWPHGEAARAFGVFNEVAGCANRATFLIDADGTVVDAFESPDLGTARPADRYREAIAKL